MKSQGTHSFDLQSLALPLVSTKRWSGRRALRSGGALPDVSTIAYCSTVPKRKLKQGHMTYQ